MRLKEVEKNVCTIGFLKNPTQFSEKRDKSVTCNVEKSMNGP